MAGWTDGPEYAPAERPEAFVAPAAQALVDPPAPPQLDTTFPSQEPAFVPPQGSSPDLRELVPSAAPGRNPNLPFASVVTPITAAPNPADQRNPDQPFNAPGPPLTGHLPVPLVVQPTAQLNSAPFPTSGTPQWFAPPTGQRVVPGTAQVSFGQIWKATTGWVMIPLIFGMLVMPIAPIALGVAWVSTTQIKYRRMALQRAYLITVVIIATISLVTTFAEAGTSFLEPFSFYSLLACWLLALLTPGIVGSALRNHESPDRL